MELTLKIAPEEMNDQFAHVSVLGDSLYCKECNRRMVDLTGRQKTRAQIILALSMHMHGIETR